MKRPTKVKIGIHILPIIWNEKAIRKAGKESGHDEGTLIGLYYGEHGCIYMKPRKKGVSESHSRETLLHEILHAIIDLNGVQVEGLDHDEPIVAGLSPAIMSVMEENPSIRKYVFGA